MEVNWRMTSENSLFNEYLFARKWCDKVAVSGPTESRTDKETRNRGCGQEPGRKGDEVHRVSRWYGVATRISPGAKLAHDGTALRTAGCRKQIGSRGGSYNIWCKF